MDKKIDKMYCEEDSIPEDNKAVNFFFEGKVYLSPGCYRTSPRLDVQEEH